MLNTIIQWDCLEVMKWIPDKSIDLVLTDPPYWMSFVSSFRNERTKHKAIENDDSLEWVDDFLLEIKRISKPEAHAYIFCSMHHIDTFVSKIKHHLNYKNIIVWEKNNTWMWDLEWDYAPKYEFCIFCSGTGEKKLNGSRDPNIMKWNKTWNDLHPTQKPVEMCVYLIQKSSSPWDLVLDCFAWSGTTWVACIESGRNYILIEKDTEYCQIIERRLKSTTPPLFVM